MKIGDLSPSLENYIETIYDLILEKKLARVKDIADKKNVSMPSVNGAIKRLIQNGLVRHNQYDFIELTDAGEEIANRLANRHTVLKKLLIDLDVEPHIADKDACVIEHHISKDTVDKLIEYFEKKRIADKNTTFLKLSEILPGKKCRIKKINAEEKIKHRLLEMGMVSGEIVSVKRIAPLGDPIGIKIKGYDLSLRKSEAAMIDVELI